MARKLNGIELTRYDDLFKTDAEREADQQERVQIVPAEQVFPYARQPYSVDRPSADLVRLMDSIERTGIAEPLIVRPRSEGGYEIISGHRRDYCAKVVGLDTRPVIVRNYSNEDADSKMYVADTYNECLLAFDYSVEKGVLSKGRKLLDFRGNYGMPDGMSMDADDNLYICHWTGQISVWNHDLQEQESISFPTPQVTCGGFGGKDMKDFYVGSGSWGYSAQDKLDHPGCGGFFVARSEIAGMPYYRYQCHH